MAVDWDPCWICTFFVVVHIIGSSEIVFVLLLDEWNVYLFSGFTNLGGCVCLSV